MNELYVFGLQKVISLFKVAQMRQMQRPIGIRGKKLTSKETARFLGVSEASVKRWADSGLLPTEKTAGGHRRFRPEDVSLMRREKLQGKSWVQNSDASEPEKSPTKKPARRSGPKIHLSSERRQGLVQETFLMLTEGRTEEISSLLVNLSLHGSSVGAIADRFLCPAMRRVGDLWYRGELSVAVEHVATGTAMQGIERLGTVSGFAENPNLLALCCSAEGDFHELPVQIAVATLKAQGFEVFILGPSTPFFALTEAVERFQPRLVCVAATIQLISLEAAVRDYAQFHKLAQRVGSSIVLGGAGFEAAEIRGRLPADLHAESFQQLEDFVEPIIQEVIVIKT
jgi:excisionase family DNA binding protein